MVGTLSTPVQLQLLNNLSNKIVPQGFICEEILPEVQVVQTTGKIGKYGNNHLRIVSSVTGGKNEYRRIDTRQYSTDTYNIEKHGLSDILAEEDFANTTDPFNAKVDAIEELVGLLFLEKEKSLADTITDTSVITQNVTLSGTSQLSDFTNSDPLGVFTTAIGTVQSNTGMVPNVAIMSFATYNKLRTHSKLLDQLGYKYNRTGGLNDLEMATALGVDRLLIGKSVYNSAAEGQTDVLSSVWGKHILFAVCPPKAAKRQISLGYRFQKGMARRVNEDPVKDPVGALKVLVDDSYDQLISNAKAAYLIKDAIA
jgi:hypothetical protein